MRGCEVTCLSAFFSVCSSGSQTVQQNLVEVLLGTWMPNDICPSVQYFDNVFEKLRIHYWSRAMTLNSSNVGWSAVIMLLTTSFKTVSVRSQFQLFEPHFCGWSRIDVRQLFPLFSTGFQGQAPSMPWKFGSDLKIFVDSLEIICCSCEFLALYPTHIIVFRR